MPEYRRIRTVHVEDPRDTILNALEGELPNVELWGSSVLVGLYIRPATHVVIGGNKLEVPKEAVDEDRYQGKVGMVLMAGPLAFTNNERDYPQRIFNGLKAEVGDWVVFRASDGLKMMIGKHECRCIPDINIRAKITHPDAVF